MLKYDVDLNENSDNSLSLILRNVKRNSVILEFGPATGRMTKYLKEKLNCDVYIVELDPESAKTASQYSKDCLIGNIEDFGWLEYFDGVKFDYIIFADVLEHLYYPQRVLLESKRLLRDDGSIFISIPNVAHNSIIIDLINNRFNYQEIGLLDNTHIRFFTYYSLMEMFERAYLKPVKSLATYNRPHDTELNNNYDFLDNEMLKFLLKNKQFGEVYQFVFELKRSSNEELIERNIQTTPNYYFTQLFVNDGNGFNESQSIVQYVNYTEKKLDMAFDLSNFNNIAQIRIDPLNSPCILKLKTIVINNEIEINNWETNSAIEWGQVFVFDTNDSQILIDTSQIGEVFKIEIAFELFAYNPDFTSLISHFVEYCSSFFTEQEQVLMDKNNTISALSNQVRALNDSMEQSNIKLSDLRLELEQVKQSKENVVAKLTSKEEEVTVLQEELQSVKQRYDQINNQLIQLMNSRKGIISKIFGK
ncbi:Methyltransferase domain-containing protein [Paenibacillus sp. cl141a]|uniref:class I SAM-dependent methyltransferase n=1 Tax=Paenibacillus sp. cl141a TaxID=1761877 RepID=UPI0008B77DC7|nr:class I SAM-dependent methyltransferase [Paenibacillus sp. cl141a]SEL34209.1 Methyltransferase domain-containing protein [Paenibacillus sp. cl141a]